MKLNTHDNSVRYPASNPSSNPSRPYGCLTLLSKFEKHIETRVEYRDLARFSTVNALSSSLSALSLSHVSTEGVHTRFPISPEIHTKQRLVSAELTEMPHKRCEQTLRIGMRIQSAANRLKRGSVYERLTQNETCDVTEKQKMKKLKELSLETEGLLASIRDAASAIDSTRDHYESLLSKETQRAEAAERTRVVAVSSLRSRWERQKSQLEEEVASLRNETQFLRKELFAKQHEVAELESCWESSVFDADILKEKVAIMEDGEKLRLLSRELTDSLSGLGALASVRQHEGLCMVDKFRDLSDAVKELVKEVIMGRKESTEMTERVFRLEEERLMWIDEEEIEDEYHLLM